MTAAKKRSDRMAWFKMDAGAFLADTTGLPAAHVGIYMRLLTLYWTSGNRLPPDRAILKRKLQIATTTEEATLEEVLAEFFPQERNTGLDAQLDEVTANSRMQSAKAKTRFQKPVTQPLDDVPDF